MEDSRIIALYFQRDEAAIAQTAAQYGKRLRQLAYGIVEDLGAAEECENDTYAAAWNAIPPKDPQEYFYPFLARITRNLALNRLRRTPKGKLVELTAELEAVLPAREADSALGEAITAFLAALPKRERVVFLRRYWYCDSIREIAQRYGYSESKVKTMLYRTRGKLKTYLEEEGYDV